MSKGKCGNFIPINYFIFFFIFLFSFLFIFLFIFLFYKNNSNITIKNISDLTDEW